MVHLRSVLGVLIIVIVFFGVPIAATLLAGEDGLPRRVVGWLTLLLMCVLAYFLRASMGRLLFGRAKLPADRPRRSHRL